MKYIRTKDGIIDLNSIHLDGSPIYNLDTKENVIKAKENGEERNCYYIENDTFYHYWYGDGCIWEEHIINQSDNLAELCDEFIYDNKIIRFESGSKKYFYYLGDVFDFDIDEKMIKEGIYGAIWTDKGLIYVAKMNDEGKLVLI